MKFIDEYRDEAGARRLADLIGRTATRPWTIMEVCGGQTHAIVRFGLDVLLPDDITLVHGPGCPVCVTPVELIDKAIEIGSRKEAILCSFGDMLRVPGSRMDLLSVKARGGDIRVVYSPLDALRLATETPDREVVFFAVGFETTAPANAMAVHQALTQGVQNFSILVSHVLVPPAMETILSAPGCRVQGFLAAGHVCTIMGYHEYEPIARDYMVPIVVTGFEPIDILQGLAMCVQQLERREYRVENQYSRSVQPDGNHHACELIRRVFRIVPRRWRGIGSIDQSGLALTQEYERFDAERRFELSTGSVEEPRDCISGFILQGIKKPHECQAFGTKCTPDHPLGAPMVSGEGACAAYYRYHRVRLPEGSS
jgi:hydrogenase expression/formation protein HypD